MGKWHTKVQDRRSAQNCMAGQQFQNVAERLHFGVY